MTTEDIVSWLRRVCNLLNSDHKKTRFNFLSRKEFKKEKKSQSGLLKVLILIDFVIFRLVYRIFLGKLFWEDESNQILSENLGFTSKSWRWIWQSFLKDGLFWWSRISQKKIIHFVFTNFILKIFPLFSKEIFDENIFSLNSFHHLRDFFIRIGHSYGPIFEDSWTVIESSEVSSTAFFLSHLKWN